MLRKTSIINFLRKTESRDTGDYELAPTSARYLYGGWLAGLGVALAAAFLYIPSRCFQAPLANSRIITRMAFVPESKTFLIETPHMFLPFSKVRVMAAPLRKLSLSSPVFTGKGKQDKELSNKLRRLLWHIPFTRTVPVRSSKCSREANWLCTGPGRTVYRHCKGFRFPAFQY
jgi:hypothetical protein